MRQGWKFLNQLVIAEQILSDEPLDALLHWLEREPADDPAEDLRALAAQLDELPLSAAPPDKTLLALKGASELGFDICARIRARLQQANLPLAADLCSQAEQIARLLFDIATRIAQILPAASEDLPAWRAERERCLMLLAQTLLTAAMSAGAPPPGLWRLAHQLGAINVDSPVYSLMLALSAAAPESSTPRELVWLADFLVEEELILTPLPAADEVVGLWWVLPGLDTAPVSSGLRVPAVQAQAVYFNFGVLIDALNVRLRQLQASLSAASDEDEEAAVIELLELDVGEEMTPGLAPTELIAYLRRLRERWQGSSLRSQVRRPQQQLLELCIGLRQMWKIASGHSAAGRISQWEVSNESAGGYALVYVSGLGEDLADENGGERASPGEIEVGVPVALRILSQPFWSVCVVRWVRAPAPGRIEVGVQLLAPYYHAVRLAFRGASLRGVVPALVLPAMEPLRRQRALLAPAGSCSSRRFVLMRDGSRLYLAQARVLGIDLQTASFELFRYEIDPNPI